MNPDDERSRARPAHRLPARAGLDDERDLDAVRDPAPVERGPAQDPAESIAWSSARAVAGASSRTSR
jgi:hypothetical protein